MKTLYVLAAVVGSVLGGATPASAQPEGRRELLQILKDVGADVTASADGKNSKVYSFEYTSNQKTYYLSACLSPDKSRVWVSMALKKVDRATATANPDRLCKLLEWNQDIGPRHFKLTNGILYLSGALENRGLGNAEVRRLIEDLIGDLERTRKDWGGDWDPPGGTATTRRD